LISQQYQSLYGSYPFPLSTFAINPERAKLWTLKSVETGDSLIDSAPTAIQSILRFARDRIGYSKDIGSRFNLAIDGYGDGLGFNLDFDKNNSQDIFFFVPFLLFPYLLDL